MTNSPTVQVQQSTLQTFATSLQDAMTKLVSHQQAMQQKILTSDPVASGDLSDLATAISSLRTLSGTIWFTGKFSL